MDKHRQKDKAKADPKRQNKSTDTKETQTEEQSDRKGQIEKRTLVCTNRKAVTNNWTILAR